MSNSSKKPMTQTDAARIQSTEAKANGGKVAKDGFASRAQSAAARNIANQKNNKR
jgi:hypothetical protein